MPESEQKRILAQSYFDPRDEQASDVDPTESKYKHSEATMKTSKWQ